MSEVDKHYDKTGEEHHARAIRLGLNWYQGNITKYAERAPNKGVVVADILKVLDYAAMWLGSEDKKTMPVHMTAEELKKLGFLIGKLDTVRGKRGDFYDRMANMPSTIDVEMRKPRQVNTVYGPVMMEPAVYARFVGGQMPVGELQELARQQYNANGAEAGAGYVNQDPDLKR